MLQFLKKQDQQFYDNIIMIASFQHIPNKKMRLEILHHIYRVLNYR